MMDEYRASIFKSVLLAYHVSKFSSSKEEEFCKLFNEDKEEIFSFYNLTKWTENPYAPLEHLKSFVNEAYDTFLRVITNEESIIFTKEYEKVEYWVDLTITDPAYYVPTLVDILEYRSTVPSRISISYEDAMQTLGGLIQ